MAGPIVISVLGDTRDLVRSLGQGESRLGRFGRAAGAVGRVAATGLAAGGAAVVAWGAASVKSLARIEQINTQTATALKSTGGAAGVTLKHIQDLTGGLEDLTATEAESIQQGGNLLLTFTNIQNKAGKGNAIFDRTTRTMVDMSRALGQDTTTSALQLGKALNDPIKGVGALSRVGVSFTAGQKETIKTLVESGNTMGAQKVILRELNKEFGGSGKAFAGTTQGKIALAGHAFGTLGETIFAKLLPPLADLAVTATDFLTGLNKYGPQVNRFAGMVGDRLGGAFETIRPALQAFGVTFRTSILPAITGVASYIASTFGPVLSTVVGIIRDQVLPTVVKFGTFIYGTLYPAVVQIGTQVATKLRPVFDQLALTFQTQVLPAVSVLLAKFEEARPTIQKVILVAAKITGTVLTLAAAILGKVLPPLIRLAGFLVGTLFRAVGLAIGILVRIVTTVSNFGRKVGEVAGDVTRFATKVGDTINRLPGKIVGALGNAKDILLESGKDIIRGLMQGIRDMAGDLVATIKSYVIDKIPGPVKKALGISSPSKVFEGIGRNVVEGLIVGVGKDSRQVETTMSALARDLAGSFDPAEMSVRPSLALAGAGVRGSGTQVNITVEVPVGASMVEAGRAVAEALADYYDAGGKRP
jgi:hypothetical protein